MKNHDVILKKLSYEKYYQLRNYRFSSDSLEYDDPDRLLPSEEEEKNWWNEDVITNNHVILAIENNGVICGVVNAFSFDRINNSCEIGIEIYPKNNFSKGLGKISFGLFIEYLKEKEKIRIVKAETNIRNNAMIKILEYFHFKKTMRHVENEITWQCFEKNLELMPRI